MTTTTNLELPLVDVNQSQKEVTVNQAFVALDGAICGTESIGVEDGDNAFTATQVRESQHLVLLPGTPGPSAGFAVVLPAVRRMLLISNVAGYDATVRCVGAGSPPQTVTIADGQTAVLFCDSAEVYGVSATASSSAQAFIDLSDVPASYSGQGGKTLRVNGGETAVEFYTPSIPTTLVALTDTPANYTGHGGKVLRVNSGETAVEFALAPFDATAFYPGVPTASAIVLRVPVARAIAFPANFSGSYGTASVAATASTAFDIQKNGSSIGTATFAISATTATFVSSGGAAQTFAAGDRLSIIAPATPDATLANVGFVLAGTR